MSRIRSEMNVADSNPMDTHAQLLEALRSCEPMERNKAALDLKELAEIAVPALLQAICQPANKYNNGTLVYALMAFNCSDHFAELFSLAASNSSYEVQCHALSILQEQRFAPSDQELNNAEQLLNAFQLQNTGNSSLEQLCSELREIISRFRERDE